MWFIGVEAEQETSAPPPKKILDPPLTPGFNPFTKLGIYILNNQVPVLVKMASLYFKSSHSWVQLL